MPWRVDLSKDAEKALDRLPRDLHDRLAQAFDELETDPFRSNIKALKGPKWKGRYRKRVGPYRIIFTADHTTKIV